MSWAEIIRDSLQRIAPYVLWVVLALGTSILLAFIRDPLSRLLREAREQLRALRGRLLARSALSLGRKSRRFWQARQSEPARTVAGALDRLAEALPNVGKKSLGRVATLQADLQKQLGILDALGLHPPSPQTAPRDTASTTPVPMGSWWKLLLLGFIAGLTGAANSFLLNEFFQGVLTSDPLFPSAFPDLHVSHIFAVLIFMMEVAIGFALHHFAEEHKDESPARKLLAFAPWLVLAGLVCLEGWAYALLSYQIDIPERLNLSPNSGLYTFARYFLALFGAGLTLLLSSLGYLLGREVDKLHTAREARQQERLLKRSGWVISGGADQVERTVQALAGLRAAAQSFQLDLVLQFKREIDATGRSENLQAAVRDAMAEILDSAGQVDGTRARWLVRRENGERPPIRTRTQALADMCLFTVALILLVALSWISVEYVAAFVRSVQGGRPSGELFGLVSGVVMTGFALSAGYVAGRALGHGYHGSAWSGQRLLRVAVVSFPLAAGAGLVAIAIANRTLGPSTQLNLLFGLLHAGILLILGAGADAALVNTSHLLRLAGVYLERGVVSLGAMTLWMPRAILAVLDWTVRLVAVFGSSWCDRGRPFDTVRSKFPAEPGYRGRCGPPPGGLPTRPTSRWSGASVSEISKAGAGRRVFSWWPAGTIALAAIALLYALRPSTDAGITPVGSPSSPPGGLSSRIRGPEIEPAAWFVYLIDISGSTHVGGRRRRRNPEANRERDTPYNRALSLISESVLGLRQLTEALPQRHSVMAITTASLYQKPLCEITVPRVNLFTGGDTLGMMTSIERCDSTLRNIRWSSRTDIRGALKLAGLVLEQKPGRVRGIILVSDLEETLRPGQEAAVPSLHGECVLLVPQITPAVARTPSLLDKRIETWRQLILEWGASRVEVRPVPAFSPGDVVRFFRQCGKTRGST